jgi:hypothetical protein
VTEQRQEGGSSSTNIQAGGNVTVNQGVSLDDVRAVARDAALETLREQTSSIGVTQAGGFHVRVLVLENLPAWERKAVKRLAESDPAGLEWLRSQVGEPADLDRVVAVIEAWPERLASGSFDLGHVLARQAERGGRWAAASTAWERLARAADDSLRADRLVCAAIDAKTGGDDARQSALLDEAELLDPDLPRLRLTRLVETQHGRPASEQLQSLENLHTDDTTLASMIAVQCGRAALMVTDLDLAETHLAAAAALDPESIAVEILRVNLRVQRARLGLHNDRDFPLSETRDAKESALTLRDEMMGMERWQESAWLLVLAGDVPALMRDFVGAREILARADPREISLAAPMLGEAALRVGAPDLALELTRDAERTDAIRRIRACAAMDVVNRPDSTSLSELRAIALGGGPESEYAAISRLLACVPPIKAPWDDAVAAIPQGDGAERFVPALRIYHLGGTGHVVEAEAIAEQLPATMWGAELRLRASIYRGAKSGMRAAADRFLSFGPDAPGRLLVAATFAQTGDTERAGQMLAVIAHEENAPPLIRSTAFAMLMQTLAERDMWEQAQMEFNAWKQLAPRLPRLDDRISAWEVPIARRASKHQELVTPDQ